MGYENYCELHYEDDGKGFDINNFTKGIGFRSIDFRVQLLNADIQLESNINKGLFIYIKIPLNK
jgi:signal transduction histidine kinase